MHQLATADRCLDLAFSFCLDDVDKGQLDHLTKYLERYDPPDRFLLAVASRKYLSNPVMNPEDPR